MVLEGGGFLLISYFFMLVSGFTVHEKVCGQHSHGDAGDCL